MNISPRTGKPMITNQDISSVQRFSYYAEALRLNFEGPIGKDAEEVLAALGVLMASMNADIESRKKPVSTKGVAEVAT